jgi:tetratricopeptide (TPR) repeat protein
MIALISLFLVFGSPTQENHEDIIKKAQTLILQRDRDKALQVLQFAIERETKNVAATKKLISTMTQMGEMVFTERGQQMLETAESLVTSDPPQALDLYKETLKMEQGNLRIEAQIAKAYFLQDDCDNAANFAEGILQTHPWHETGIFLLAQARVCKNNSLILKESQISYIQDDWVKSYVSIAQTFLAQEYLKLLRETEVAIKKFPDFSELYWFRAQALIAQKQSAAKEINKYKELCNAKPSALPLQKSLLYSCKHKDKI